MQETHLFALGHKLHRHSLSSLDTCPHQGRIAGRGHQSDLLERPNDNLDTLETACQTLSAFHIEQDSGLITVIEGNHTGTCLCYSEVNCLSVSVLGSSSLPFRVESLSTACKGPDFLLLLVQDSKVSITDKASMACRHWEQPL